MLRAAVVEPDKNRREMLKACLSGCEPAFRTADFSNIRRFCETLDENCTGYDLVILNTTVSSEGDGVRLAADLRSRNARLMLIFVSDTTAYYAEAFARLVTAYLICPFDLRHLFNAIAFFFPSERLERRASIMLKETGGNYRRVYARSIRYLESANREILLHLEDGTTLSCYDKLTEAEQVLPDDLFFRCHQSYLVNFYFTESMTKDAFVVAGIPVPISRKYSKSARDAYLAYVSRPL